MILAALLIVFASAGPAPDVSPGAILGIEAGMPAEDARRILAPLGRSESRALSAGTKEVWKFETGGYEWIAFRSDARGRIVWLTGRRRAGQEISFDALPAAPAVATDSIAIFHSKGTYGGQRLTLRGARRAALVVTLAVVEE
jgi:hypothetical protein